MTNALTDLTILIAEGDKATRTFVADNLTADGADVETAHDCAEALRRTYCGPARPHHRRRQRRHAAAHRESRR
jgi:hypothetical protein